MFRLGCIVLMMWVHTAFSQQRYAVVIHEFFPDPVPSMGLPAYEFVELRNLSRDTVQLKGWKISDGTSTATIAASFRLAPDSVVVLCPTAAVTTYGALGPALGVTSFPSLNNDADLLILMAPDGKVVHALSYDLSWYHDGVKQEGGWSIEMIDAKRPCEGLENYQASQAARGGTPGRQNSVATDRRDVTAPALLQAVAEDALHVRLYFSEPVDSLSLIGAVTLQGRSIVSFRANDLLWQDWLVSLRDPLQEGSMYKLEVVGVQDCVGNRSKARSVQIALPQLPQKGDVVINEILFDPPTNGYDYVEIWNQGDRVLDLSKMLLARWDEAGKVVQASALATTTHLLFPGSYVVLTTRPDWLQAHYSAVTTESIVSMSSFPSMPDDAGSVLLCRQDGTVLDAVSYSADWHLPVLQQREGVALERIDGRGASSDPGNWTSAAATVGWGTPGKRNSQQRSMRDGAISLGPDPKVFSPNLDGVEDHTTIQIQALEVGLLVTIRIYDEQGRMVRVLLNNRSVPIGASGYVWDGLDDHQQLLASGIYIVTVQYVSLKGIVKNARYAVAINRW